MNRRDFLATSTALALPMSGAAADSSDDMIHNFLASEVERLSKNFMDGAKTKDEWLKKRPQLQQQFLDMAGLWPLPEKTELKVKITSTFDHGDVTIENLHYQSKPGLYVTGNLYRPKKSEGKLPAVLYVCGHSNKGRDGNKTAYHDHGYWFASNGYVCLVVDTLQLGEVAGKHHGTYNLDRFWWHSRGYTPAGVELWNGIRGIDYLVSRPDVDAKKIGVTGISGGGATSVWIAAADDRVKVAVPVSGMSDLQSYVTNKVVEGHCDCMFVYNLYRWEWTTILALFAPKPLLFANSDNDTIFPMDGNRRIMARLRPCYEMLGAKDKVFEYVSKGGHAYREDLRAAIFGHFNLFLRGDQSPVPVKAVDPKIDGAKLCVFPTDADLPKDAINDKADETFVPVAEVKLPEAKDYPAWRTALMNQLRERVFASLPEKMPAAKANTKELALETEPGVFCDRLTLKWNRRSMGTTVLVVLNPDEEEADALKFWSKIYSEDDVMLGFRPRGGGKRKWTKKNPPNTVERSFALLGSTVDTSRVRDVVAWLGGTDSKETDAFRLVGRGQAGIIAAYAALFTTVGKELVVADPPLSHREGPHFLGVQRVLDIPEALGLLAPRIRLTLRGKNAKDPAFDKTSAMFRLAGGSLTFA